MRPEPAVKAAFMRRSDSGADNRTVDSPACPPSPSLRPGAAALLVLALLAAGPAPAGDDRRDHERARAAVQSGQVLPLATLLQQLQRSHPGQVLEVELEREGGRWVYELRLLQPGGRVLKLELDAATGAVLKARARGATRAPEPPPPAP
jgi:hypothetical protein